MTKQTTLKEPVTITGVGVHTGAPIDLKILPANQNSGFVFKRSDLPGAEPILGRWDCVSDTRLCTQLTNQQGTSIGTVEHLLAGLAAHEIDNAEIVVSGPEIPILDGSSKVFIDEIEKAGVVAQETPRVMIRLKKTIEIREENRYVRLDPLPESETSSRLTYDFSFDFFGGREGMKPQSYHFPWDATAFRQEIGSARTFGFFEDGQKLQAMGLAQGASLENTVVIQEGKVMNEEGLRFPDEFVKHKILDAVGDLSLAGYPLSGAYYSHNGGHELNNRLLRLLFETPEAWEKVLPNII